MDDKNRVIELIEIGYQEETVSEIAMESETAAALEPKPRRVKDQAPKENGQVKETESFPEDGSIKDNKPRDIMREIFSYAIIIAAALVAALVVNRFVIINAHVPSASMYPTINTNDRLIGFRLAYLFSKPERGDIIIFRFPDDETQTFIKRVIGIPGDTIEIVDGTLYLNGEPQEEPYLAETMVGSFGPYEVPEECYFVLGDNRNISEDARYWDNTYVTAEQILAKALLRYSPSFTIFQ